MESVEEEEDIKLVISEEEDLNLHKSQSISEKEFERKTYYETCCGSRIDKRALQFFSQLTISLIVMICNDIFIISIT